MKSVCLGYYDKTKFDTLTQSDRNAMYDECYAYEDNLRASGNYSSGVALLPAETARTLSWRDRKAATTDGPFAETKEQLGGIGMLEARDMDHALQLMSHHPALKYGTTWEIRPAGDMTPIRLASDQRRRALES